MRQHSEEIVFTISSTARKVTLLIVVFFLLYTLIWITLTYLKLEFVWLSVFGDLLFVLVFFLLAIRWMASGLLFIFGYPRLAFAWFRGAHLNWHHKQWEELSEGEKKFILLNSIAPLVFVPIMTILILLWITK